MYFFLSSNAFKNIYPNNSPWDFTSEIYRPVQVSGKGYKIALTEIEWDIDDKLPKKDMYVYCDLLDHETLTSESYLPLLRIVKEPLSFVKYYFMDVSRDYISRIRIYIRMEDGSVPQFETNHLRCTLCLKKIK